MVGEICPKCGSRTHPGCAAEDCKNRWCERAKCSWENDELCFSVLQDEIDSSEDVSPLVVVGT